MPRSRSKLKKARSLEDIEQVWRCGHGIQRMCACQDDDIGPCSPDNPRHDDVDFGPPLSKQEIDRLRKAKRQAHVNAMFGQDGVASNSAFDACIEWLEFERKYAEHNQDHLRKGRENQQAYIKAIKQHLHSEISKWWQARTKNDSE